MNSILGRNPALFVGLIGTVLNVAVAVFGVPLTVDQLVALNGLGLAVIGVIANESDPSTLTTLAASVTCPKA